jgi:hypothetical protein
MPILNFLTKGALKPVPRMLPPQAHMVVDYVMVGSFLASAAWFWRRNKRAALASAICAGAELAVSALTDYSGRFRKPISFRAHHDMELGLAALTATMPEFLAFKDSSERKFFLAQGVLLTGIAELTQFHEKRPVLRSTRSKAA